jgi:hypothetical protein
MVLPRPLINVPSANIRRIHQPFHPAPYESIESILSFFLDFDLRRMWLAGQRLRTKQRLKQAQDIRDRVLDTKER